MIRNTRHLALVATVALAAVAVSAAQRTVINVQHDGTLIVAGRKVTKKELADIVKAAVRADPHAFIIVEIDKRVLRDVYVPILSLIHENGGKIGAYGSASPDQEARMAAPSKTGYTFKQTDTSLAMVKGEKVIWQFNFDKTEGKPYFHPLCTTDGTLLTALRPKDHPWHRALWFSWKHINGLNYWEENRQGLSQGRTEIKTITIQAQSGRPVTINMTLSFHPPGKGEIMSEKCTIVVSPPNAAGVFTIDWTSTFTAGEKDVFLDRAPIKGEKGGKGWGGYAGLSLRLSAALKKWPAVDSEGRKDMKIHGQQAKSMGFGDQAGRGGIFMEAHESTLGVPRWYIAKGMPYFSPAVLFAKPLTIKAGKSLKLAYTITIYPAKRGK